MQQKNLLFSLDPEFELAKKISEKMNIPLSPIKVSNFADGEIYCQALTSVRSKRVFLIHTISNPVNENLMKLFIAIDSFKRSAVSEINIIIPYFAYARQDRKTEGRTSISSKLMADLITTAGADRLLLVELHSDQIQGFFKMPTDHLNTIYLIADYLVKNNWISNLVIVSPDFGAVKRSRILAELLNLPLAIIDKKRNMPNQAESLNVFGEVKNKNCLIIDDIVDTGGTIIGASHLLKKFGAQKIYIAATHGVFSKNALEKFDIATKENIIEKVFITDSLPIEKKNYIEIISISSFLSEILKIYINNSGSITNLYENYKNKILISQNSK